MSKTRSKKEEELASLTDRLARMKTVVFSSYQGLKVKDVTIIRKKLRAEGIDYAVAKKTLLKRALANSGVHFSGLEDLQSGVALAFDYADEVAPARILNSFRKQHENITFLGGIVGGVVYSGAEIEALAKLPTRQELLAKIIGSMASPLSGFVRVAAGPLSGFVRVLQARSNAN